MNFEIRKNLQSNMFNLTIRLSVVTTGASRCQIPHSLITVVVGLRLTSHHSLLDCPWPIVRAFPETDLFVIFLLPFLFLFLLPFPFLFLLPFPFLFLLPFPFLFLFLLIQFVLQYLIDSDHIVDLIFSLLQLPLQ